MKKLAVIFPGVGYTTDKPLLYYAGKIVKQYGFEVVNISYGNLPKSDIMKMFDYAMTAANAAVNRISFEEYDKIFFISKSIGTAVAGTIQKNLPQKVYHIFFTPIHEAVPFLCEGSIVFTGSRDPMVNVPEIVKRHENVKFDLHIAKEANHSLETGDVVKDIMILRKIEELCESFVREKMNEE